MTEDIEPTKINPSIIVNQLYIAMMNTNDAHLKLADTQRWSSDNVHQALEYIQDIRYRINLIREYLVR